MTFEMPDGSQFSLHEVWSSTVPGHEQSPEFLHTSISANVDGKAYFGRVDERAEDVDEGDLLSGLVAVPPDAIYPLFEDGFTRAPGFDASKHYLKAPSFTWEDCQPGVTFVAECMLNEISVLEKLQSHRHANIVSYHGCVVRDGRITHVCLERCRSNIVEYVEREREDVDLTKLISEVATGIEFLHSLGLAHNDINPENVCVVDERAVIIDFDSTLPFGSRLMKGVSVALDDDGQPVSDKENDLRALEDVEDFLSRLLALESSS